MRQLRKLLAILFFALPFAANGQQLRIDSITLERNWRTRDKVILRELGFKEGDVIEKGLIDTAIHKIWNIGNFATVDYRLDTGIHNENILQITARDAFTIIPIFSPQGSGQDFNLDLGLMDGNFLGRNIKLMLKGKIGTNANSLNLDLFIPRQLLYRNMTLQGGVFIGDANYYRYEEDVKVSGIAYLNREAYLLIGNPFHEDYRYTFSPNLGLRFFQHRTDSTLLDPGIATTDYLARYLNIEVDESVGTINYKRHQKDGFTVNFHGVYGLGLNTASEGYFRTELKGEYNRLFNKTFQLSTKFETGYCSSDLPSLLYYKGAGDVKGILTGMISGKSFYTGYLGLHMTWVNIDWFALEHSVYMNVGNGADRYGNLFSVKPLYAVGTGLRFMIPMVPWLFMQFNFSYSPSGNNWFFMEF